MMSVKCGSDSKESACNAGGVGSRLFQSFPQFVVIHTVKGFGIVNNAGTLLLFLMIQQMLAV